MKHNNSSSILIWKTLMRPTIPRLILSLILVPCLNACLEESRVLKRSTDYLGIESPPIELPQNQSFDLDGILNFQIHEVVDEGGQFVIYNRLDEGDELKAFVASGPRSQLNENDKNLLNKYGFSDPTMGIGRSLVAPIDDLSCILSLPQIKVKGQVRAFELTDRAGFKIGFSDIFAGAIADVGVKFQIASARFEMGLQAYDSLTGIEVAASVGSARQSSVDFLLDLGRLPLEANYFHKTPLAKITSRGLERALKDLASILDDKFPSGIPIYPWESRVVAFSNNNDGNVENQRVLMLGGSEDGMQSEDEFFVTNLNYIWEREPCQSKLKDRVPAQAGAQAELTIIETGLRYSVGNMKMLHDRTIRLGAQVKLKNFRVSDDKRRGK